VERETYRQTDILIAVLGFSTRGGVRKCRQLQLSVRLCWLYVGGDYSECAHYGSTATVVVVVVTS